MLRKPTLDKHSLFVWLFVTSINDENGMSNFICSHPTFYFALPLLQCDSLRYGSVITVALRGHECSYLFFLACAKLDKKDLNKAGLTPLLTLCMRWKELFTKEPRKDEPS